MMMEGCQHLCKYLSTPLEARRFVSDHPNLDLSRGSQSRNVNSLAAAAAAANSNQGMSTDPSSLQHLLQLQATGGLGNMLSSPHSRQDSLSSLALSLSAGQSTLPNTLNPTSLQLLAGNNMQNRSSAIASYITELQLRQQQQGGNSA